jgi:pyruvate carboxylase subunit B
VILDARVDGEAHRVEVRGSKGRYTVIVDGRTLDVDWRAAGGPFASLLVGGRSHTVGLEPRTGGYRVLVGSDEFVIDLLETTADAGAVQRAPSGPARLVAPMPGRIVRVLAEPGQQVEAGQGLVVMEAMKMENELRAASAGTVKAIRATPGTAVERGTVLVELD